MTMVDNALVPMEDRMAKLTITYNGQQGDLADPVAYDSTDGDLKQIAAEALRQGYVQGIDRVENPDFTDFMVDRFPRREDIMFNRLSLRPKTPFGAEEDEKGVQAIIFLQKCANIDEPVEKAKASWASFSEGQKKQTMLAYKAMGGE